MKTKSDNPKMSTPRIQKVVDMARSVFIRQIRPNNGSDLPSYRQSIVDVEDISRQMQDLTALVKQVNAS